jgi:mono/diheme cytochrome c family protein
MCTLHTVIPLAGLLALLTAAAFQAPPAVATSAVDQTPKGDALFHTYCASCHGTSAMGDGALATELRRRPADLTKIARRNKGVFPREQVYRTIDGRQPVRGHGAPGMPVWGDVFVRTVGNEAVITARIEALVAYLEGLQARDAN